MAAHEPQPKSMHCAYRIEGLDCPDCAATLEKGLREVEGITAARVHFNAASLDVDLASPEVAQALQARVRALGFRLASIEENPEQTPTFWEQHIPLLLTAAAALAWLTGGVLALGHLRVPATIAFAASILIGGLPIFRRAYASLLTRTLDLHVLMTIALLGAAAIGEWGEGAAVVVLFAIGNMLEAYTTRHARHAIGQLMEKAPHLTRLRRNGSEVTVPVEEARVGETALVRPGEQIPLDGMVSAGASTVNEATITGESIPAVKGRGDTVYAGTLNERGALEIEITRAAHESAYARIIQLVEAAQEGKPRVQQQIDRFAQYYTPAIVVLALLVAVAGILLQVENPIVRALALLIIGCPCALVLASPIVILAGVGRAARQGVLITQGQFLETGSRITALAFDKTGTLTAGRPKLLGIAPATPGSEQELLALAAGLEQFSEHPIGQAIRAAAHRAHLAPAAIADFEALTGLGVRGTHAGQELRLGNPRLWPDLPAAWRKQVRAAEEEGDTVLLLERGGEICGLFALADEPRPEAASVVRALRERGLSLVMLTGDTEQTARVLAGQVGIEQVAARLLPAEKVAHAQELRTRYGAVAMVGDGVNDAPALANATLGIAVATAGNDTAIASADVVLIGNNLVELPWFFDLCRRSAAIVRQNIVFALALKLALVGVAIAGLLPLWLAVVGDVGATVLVILNGMRLLR